jgi:hypothetical protein
MAIMTTSFETFGLNVSHAWESCAATVVDSIRNIRDRYEVERQKISTLTREKLSPEQAYLVDRIASAIPEVFVALSSLWGSLLTIPALGVSWGLKIEPLIPIIKTVLNGDMSPNALGDGLRHSLDNFDRMFERVIVPSLFVAFVVDSIYSFTVGWLAQDFGRMLHGTAIALPGAFLTLRYMLAQRTAELSTEAPALSLLPTESNALSGAFSEGARVDSYL